LTGLRDKGDTMKYEAHEDNWHRDEIPTGSSDWVKDAKLLQRYDTYGSGEDDVGFVAEGEYLSRKDVIELVTNIVNQMK